MPTDLIVYALVAAGLVFWLRSVLGTRTGEERERPNPFLAGEGDDIEETIDQIREHVGPTSMSEKIKSLSESPRNNCSIKNAGVEAGLIDIADADKDFDIDFFFEGAQDAFVLIVESFSEGDREMLKDLLSEDVYAAFDGAIAEREKNDHTQITDIHAIRQTEIVDAELDGRRALITVRFVAEESSVTKDADGEVIAGHPDKTHEMQDIWVLARDVKSKDPSWLLLETRGDFDEDNELIPDTH